MNLMSVAAVRLYAMSLVLMLAAPPGLAAAGAMIAAGGDASVILKADGSLWEWGRNGVGYVVSDLGYEPVVGSVLPWQTGDGYAAVTAGGNHTVALKADGSLWAWGYNDWGQLGQGSSSATYIYSRERLRVGDGYVAAAAGDNFVVALKVDGSLWAWGGNDFGQVGDGSLSTRTVPVQIGSGYSAIAAGAFHALALKPDGSLWAWGLNDSGQLGSGDTTPRDVPQQVATGYTAIAAGNFHSLALKSDGSLWAWGANTSGQVGNGSTLDVLAPQKVGEGFVAIDGGGHFSAAVAADGGLWTWGNNASGQIGNGGSAAQLTPLRIGDGYQAVALGDAHTLAMKTDGGVWAWGSNERCQVGDGTCWGDHRKPAQVLGPNGVGGFNAVVGDYDLRVWMHGNGTVVMAPSAIPTDGNGGVAMTASGITCVSGCSRSFSVGTGITLSATPDSGYTFAGWEGACTGTAQCQVSMTAERQVTARFVPLALAVQIVGNGSVDVAPAGQRCNYPGCSVNATLGQQLSLTATPEAGYRFGGWSGACTGNGACQIDMADAREVTANFVALPRVAVAPLFPLAPGNSWTLTAPSGGNTRTTTVGAAVVINGNTAYPLANGNGSVAYFSNDAQGLRLHGLYVPYGLYVANVGWVSVQAYFNPPILLAAASAMPEVRNYFSGSASVTVGGGVGSYTFNYDGDSVLADAAAVTVPLGTYPAHRLAYSLSLWGTAGGVIYSMPLAVQNWYVSGFGIVKETSAGVERVLSASNVPQPPLRLAVGWNLVGNGVEAALPVASTFNAAAVASVWKWVAAGTTPGLTYPTWAFYTPAHADGGAAHAASRGYEFLSAINAGEGFWVNALAAYAAPLPTGAAVAAASFRPAPAGGTHALPPGWSLIAAGDQPTPAGFAQAIAPVGTPSPAAGQVHGSLSTLWAWDAQQQRWYFWAPSLVNSGALADYASAKGYLDFAARPATLAGTLAPTTGFWVNRP